MPGEDSRKRTLTRLDWIEAARRQLVLSGISSVKIESLATELGATRGSFYWHFADHADLLDELVKGWVDQAILPFRRVIDADHDQPLIQLLRYGQIWLSEAFDANYESAVREWARSAEPVTESVQRVDDERLSMLVGMFDRLGYDQDEAVVRARMYYYHQVGYYALNVKQTMQERLQLFPVYFKVLTGIPMPPKEVSRMRG